jgi:hypothetical protein
LRCGQKTANGGCKRDAGVLSSKRRRKRRMGRRGKSIFFNLSLLALQKPVAI